MYKKDEYAYHGLAQLYFQWARKAASESECAEYIAKSEATISDGLRLVHVRDRLWITSSSIEEFLGNKPSSLDALRNAVETSPNSVIARYLLGRRYRQESRPKDAVEVLEQVIKSYHDEYRSFIEYALALIDLGRSYGEAIAVLRLSSRFGLGDPKYIATFGGMLFMNQQFTESDKVFAETQKRQFSVEELRSVQFRPKQASTSDPVRLRGIVKISKAGYSLIDSQGLRPVLCPASKYNGIVLRPSMEVIFELAFTAKGALADRLEVL